MRICQRELAIKETFCSPSHPIIAPRERASPHNLLSFSSRREGFFLHAILPPELLKKKKEEDGRHHALSPLFIVSHEVAKSFTKQPEHCRQRLQVPEEVITTGMSSSKSTVRRTVEWQRGGGQDTVWGRNINWNVLSWNGSAFCFRGNFWQLGILLVSAVLQSNTSRICLRNLKPVNT